MTKSAAPFQRELDALRLVSASARKSFTEYKPILVHPSNRTEVLGRAVVVDELKNFHQTFSRGTIFNNREDAVAYAEATKQLRINDVIARAARYGFELL